MRKADYSFRSVGKDLVPVLRAVPGPQDEFFSEKGKDEFNDFQQSLKRRCRKKKYNIKLVVIMEKYGGSCERYHLFGEIRKLYN